MSVDEVTAGDHVRQLAQAVAADDGVVPLPEFGKSLVFGDYQDQSVFALEYSPTLLFPDAADSMTDWSIEVTWRQLDPRRDEDPASLDKPPLEREPLYFIEYNQEYDFTDVAQPVTDRENGTLSDDVDPELQMQPIDPAVLIANTMGDRLEPLPITRLKPVLVIAKNVKKRRSPPSFGTKHLRTP